MQTELESEVTLCPSCNEEVPKTLYCLNCGYPLYKTDAEEESSEELEEVLTEVGFVKEDVEEALIGSEEVLLEEPVEETAQEFLEEVEDVSETIVSEEDEQVDPSEIQKEVEEVLELDQATEFSDEDIVNLVEDTIKLDQPVEDIEVVEDSMESVEVVESETIIEEPTSLEVIEKIPFEPDPVIKEVMVDLAKNISLKIKLADLLREEQVQVETFNRLFESYAARGERLMNSRNDMLERIKFDLDSMERALDEAKVGLKELKIRRSIGDVFEAEYNAKAPAHEWDIGQYEDQVLKKKGEKMYVEDLTQVMSEEEMAELKEIGENCHSAFEDLRYSEMISPEMIARVKVILEEAIAYL